MNEFAEVERTGFQKFCRWLVVTGSVIAVLIGVATFLGRQFVLAELINNFRFQVALGILLLALLMFYCRFLFWASLQFIFGLVVLAPVAMSFWPPEHQVENRAPNATTVSLLSYNVLGDNPNQQPVLETIQNQFADVVVVIEYENEWLKTLAPLDSIYRYSEKAAQRWHGFGIAIFSRHTLKNTTVKSTTDDSDIPCILSEVQLPGESFILAAVHFLAPLDATKMDIRNGQMKRVAELINEYRGERDMPVVLVGDFNCVAWSSYATELMRETGLTDSRQGYFYHGSWPTGNFLARIPIDNAFVSDRILVQNRTLLSGTASDHFPLYLEFKIADAEQGVNDEPESRKEPKQDEPKQNEPDSQEPESQDKVIDE